MAKTQPPRRKLELENLSAAAEECQRLLNNGYVMNGRWTLAQICRHLRQVQDGSVDGFPWWMSMSVPIRPILRWLMLPRLLRGHSPRGLPTAPMFVPPDGLDDAEEVAAFTLSVARFREHSEAYKPHPGFGKLDKKTYEAFHTAHAAHHLGFLEETEKNIANKSDIPL